MPPINADELSWATADADVAAWRRKRLGAAAGGADLGCSLY
ncbi:cupin, partial [Halorubrum sp. SS5]